MKRTKPRNQDVNRGIKKMKKRIAKINRWHDGEINKKKKLD
jgi:hypothetical protein